MKIIKLLKYSGLLALVLSIAVGCAGTPSQQSGPTKADAQAAIQAAKNELAKAKDAHWAWKDTGKMIKKAEALEAKGDYAGAVKLADKARLQAENALAQKKEEEQRLAQQKTTAPPPATNAGSYTVVKGDCLWTIAGKDSIYGNPYEWPLIYKANQGKINDPDLIYPGQDFSINHSATSAEIQAAIHHAKTRGAWSLGKVEASDKAYLAQ